MWKISILTSSNSDNDIVLHEIGIAYSQNVMTFVTLDGMKNYRQRTWTALVLAHFEVIWSKMLKQYVCPMHTVMISMHILIFL